MPQPQFAVGTHVLCVMSGGMDNSQLSIRRGLLVLWAQLSRRRRFQALAILGMMLVGAVAELMTLGAVIPFLALIGDPQSAQSNPYIGGFFAAFGWQDGDRLVIAAAILFSVIAVIAAAIRILLTRVSQKFAFRIGFDLSVTVYEGILYQPYSFHVAHNSSEIIAGMTKVQQVISQVLLPLMLGMTSLLIATFIFAALIAIDPVVALACGAGFTLVYFVVAITTRNRLRRNSAVIARSQVERIRTIQEGLGGIRDVLIDHAQPIYVKKFKRFDSALRDAQAMNALIAASPRFVVEGAGMILIAGLALVLSRQAGGIGSALPVLGALALGAQRLLPLLQQMYGSWAQVTGNRQTLFDVLGLLDRRRKLEVQSKPVADKLPFADAIRFEQVNFRYADGPLVVRDVSLEIPQGSRIGFIGKTGSGKSTIMDLMMGLLDPVDGRITVNGSPLAEHRSAWQSQIAHVPQSIYLSDASIAENIAFGVEPKAIDHDRLVAAARKADIADFIDTLEGGYQSFVGERGIRLSGGQRQRIGIARALYKEAKVLVFDEATSALDDATEASIMEAIDKLGRDLTVVMIAHRLSTVRNCDKIYRLSNGRVEASGSWEEVVAKDRSKAA